MSVPSCDCGWLVLCGWCRAVVMAGFSCSVLIEGSEGRGNGLMLECGRSGLTAVVNSSGFHAILMRMHCSSQHLPGEYCIGVLLRQCSMGIRLLFVR